MFELKDKVAVITGASRGIGAATARVFARAGASLVLNYFNSESDAIELLDEVRRAGARAIAVRADVSRFADVEHLFDAAIVEFGRIDIVVANAAIWTGGQIELLDERVWDETLDTNLKGVYACCHFAAGVMKKQGGGRIIAVSSTAGQRGEAFHSHYAASKGGIIALTKSLASELGSAGITVNCVAPGWVDTEMSAVPLRDSREFAKILGSIPIGRVANADDIAGPILFLASDLARHVTGEVLNVNGGSVLCG
ncbi:MAG TPA: 3-oxoacyl-ACP reductase family protein [Blastocatellia bacterium]|nr:3-oxoacyl-ACP reductase family protein [Blastocatellia bacterium]